MSCPSVVKLSSQTFLKVALSMFALLQAMSRASLKVDMMKRKRTGDIGSPCLTPMVCGISFVSVPILIFTLRLEYSLRITSMYLGGATYLARILKSSSWFTVS